MNPEEKLKAAGITLPKVSTPGGNYVSVNVRGNIAYVAIQFPIENSTFDENSMITEGLDLGDQVVTEGYHLVSSGVSVNVVK